MPPRLSIIIPHSGNVAALQVCLLALNRCNDRDKAEVIVAGNGPTPIDQPFQLAHRDVSFLHMPQPGAAIARNAGAACAKADILLFIDSDCTVFPDALTQALETCDTADIIGGAVIATTPEGRPLSPAQAFETVFAFDQEHYIRAKGFSVTACLMTRRDVFDAVGGFRPGLSEDLDWCHRATALGFSIRYAPQIRVSHPCRPSWGALRLKWRRLTAQTYALNVESRPRWIAKACLLMPMSILAHASRIFTSPKLLTPRDRRAAFYMLVRLRMWRMTEMLRISLRPRL